MNVGDYSLNVVYEGTSSFDITYRVAMLPNVDDTAFLFDNNNASGKWYLLNIGKTDDLMNAAKRFSAR
jgi:hypothetical protein